MKNLKIIFAMVTVIGLAASLAPCAKQARKRLGLKADQADALVRALSEKLLSGLND